MDFNCWILVPDCTSLVAIYDSYKNLYSINSISVNDSVGYVTQLEIRNSLQQPVRILLSSPANFGTTKITSAALTLHIVQILVKYNFEWAFMLSESVGTTKEMDIRPAWGTTRRKVSVGTGIFVNTALLINNIHTTRDEFPEKSALDTVLAQVTAASLHESSAYRVATLSNNDRARKLWIRANVVTSETDWYNSDERIFERAHRTDYSIGVLDRYSYYFYDAIKQKPNIKAVSIVVVSRQINESESVQRRNTKYCYQAGLEQILGICQKLRYTNAGVLSVPTIVPSAQVQSVQVQSVQVQSLQRENEDLRRQLTTNTNKDTEDPHQCKICYDRKLQVVFLPCGHMVCQPCGNQILQNRNARFTCSFCKQNVRAINEVFF